MKSIIDNKIRTVIIALLITSVFIIWEHFNGGVISHNLLGREDLPAISNWWGLLTVPSLTWIIVSIIQQRKIKTTESIINTRFLLSLVFGLTISMLWEFGLENILQYAILLPIIISLFKPVHLPECLLGFVIGMLYTFGGILPLIIGTVLVILCFAVNKIVSLISKLLPANS